MARSIPSCLAGLVEKLVRARLPYSRVLAQLFHEGREREGMIAKTFSRALAHLGGTLPEFEEAIKSHGGTKNWEEEAI
jgi:hypothetical protein